MEEHAAPLADRDRLDAVMRRTYPRTLGSTAQGGSAAAYLVQSLPALGRCRSRRAGGMLRRRSAGAGMAHAPRLLAMRQSRDGLRRRPAAYRRARLLARAARPSPPPPLPGRRGRRVGHVTSGTSDATRAPRTQQSEVRRASAQHRHDFSWWSRRQFPAQARHKLCEAPRRRSGCCCRPWESPPECRWPSHDTASFWGNREIVQQAGAQLNPMAYQPIHTLPMSIGPASAHRPHRRPGDARAYRDRELVAALLPPPGGLCGAGRRPC